MPDLMILLILLLLILPMIISISMGCYSNAYLILPSNTTVYTNFTLQSCQCLMINSDAAGFQYNIDDQSCSVFNNDSSRSDLLVKINSQVCFINRTLEVCIKGSVVPIRLEVISSCS